MLYAIDTASYKRYLRPETANEVLSAHSTISTLVSSADGTAVFKVKHYLRYAQLSIEHGDSPQKEWKISVGKADAQTARFADETEGSLAAVIASLRIGSLVALDWLQVAVRAGGTGHVEYPCQKLEPIGKNTEQKLLAAHEEVQILGLTSGMETLLRSARSNPEALTALHAAQKHPPAMKALQDVVQNGRGAVMNYREDARVAALLDRLDELELLEPLPLATPGESTQAHGASRAPPAPSATRLPVTV